MKDKVEINEKQFKEIAIDEISVMTLALLETEESDVLAKAIMLASVLCMRISRKLFKEEGSK